MNNEQKAMVKATHIFEDAINEIMKTTDDETALGYMLKGFKLGAMTAEKLYKKYNELEDIPL